MCPDSLPSLLMESNKHFPWSTMIYYTPGEWIHLQGGNSVKRGISHRKEFVQELTAPL